MKKLFLVVVLFLVGCSSNSKVDIVVSSYPVEYIVSEIVKDSLSVKNVLPDNVDAHDYDPSQKDIISASNASLVMYVSDDYDPYLSDISGVVEVYEYYDGSVDNPHFWLSPKQMIDASEYIYQAIVKKFPEHKSELKSNYDSLIDKLVKLDNDYATKLSNTRLQNFVVAHNSYEHLGDYNVMTFPLSSSDHSSEISQKQIVDTTKFIEDNSVKYIASEVGIACEICNLLESENSVSILELNSLENRPKKGDYISQMYDNLDLLVRLLQ